MKWNSLSPDSVSVFKGISILMIATHNFMHLFPFPGENEFDFSLEKTSNLLRLLWTQPENFLQSSMSFFGHFGVQVFMFLSAYGLTKKYLNNKADYWAFMWQRALKIYPAFLLAILIWVTLEGFYSYGLLGPVKMLYWHLGDIFLKLTLVSNFIPGKALEPIGPWWFIPFIFQFYFAFPWLYKLYERWQEIGIISLSVFSLVLADLLHGEIYRVNIYFTILPYLPVFCLGIYLAKEDVDGIKIPGTILLFSLLLFILGNLNQHLWVLSHFSFIIVFMALLNFGIPRINTASNIRKVLIFTGEISMAIFLVNGFLRFPMLRWAVAGDNWLITIGLCLVFLMITYLVAYVLHTFDAKISKRIHNSLSSKKVLI